MLKRTYYNNVSTIHTKFIHLAPKYFFGYFQKLNRVMKLVDIEIILKDYLNVLKNG